MIKKAALVVGVAGSLAALPIGVMIAAGAIELGRHGVDYVLAYGIGVAAMFALAAWRE